MTLAFKDDDWPADYDKVTCERCGYVGSVYEVTEEGYHLMDGTPEFRWVCRDEDACRRRKESHENR